MLAYKGFKKNLTCTMGKGTYQYIEGKWHETNAAKCASTGFHCCENPLDCLSYYALNKENVFYIVEASGDIHEDDHDKISCTRMRLIRKLDPEDIGLHACRYMYKHPDRIWNHTVCKESGMTQNMPFIIVRGKNPKAAGIKGTTLYLLQENKTNHSIKNLAVYKVDDIKIKPGTYYDIDGTEVAL